MLANLKDLLSYAEQHQIAIGAFNVPSLDFLRAVIQAAEYLNVPVIIQHAEVHEHLVTIDEIGPAMIEMAKQASVPVAVHLDHGATLTECLKALKLGFTSVMYDASLKPYEQNVRETQEIVKIAHSLGASVEAELGEMANSIIGAEGRSNLDELKDIDYYTNAEQAKDFVVQTGVDCLAVSFGTVHGKYIKEPSLDIQRLAEIREELECLPLVMHGGSGVSEDDYKKVIAAGIRKINYYTYMNLAAGTAIREYLEAHSDEDVFYDKLSEIARRAAKENVIQALRIFNNLHD